MYILLFIPLRKCQFFFYTYSLCYRVITEQRNVTLIASVKENRSSIWVPVLVRNKIPLLVGVLVDKTKMVNLQEVVFMRCFLPIYRVFCFVCLFGVFLGGGLGFFVSYFLFRQKWCVAIVSYCFVCTWNENPFLPLFCKKCHFSYR